MHDPREAEEPALGRAPRPEGHLRHLASGTLLDESLVLYTSENGDGDSHGRKNMPIMLAGHAGGFETGRRVGAANKPTGALHGSILNYLGVETAEYGDRMSAHRGL